LFERDGFDLFLPEFDKPWVIHLRETCCCSTNLCTWRPNTIYKNRRVRRHHALGLLDGSDAAPVKMLEALDDVGKKVSMPNPDYATWVARDQFVQGWLNNSDILTYVLDMETMTETWAIISAMFKSASNAKVSHLRTALNNTKKKEMTTE
jgi:hypothetical protein